MSFLNQLIEYYNSNDALSTGTIVDLDEFKEFLGITGTDEDDYLTFILQVVTNATINYTAVDWLNETTIPVDLKYAVFAWGQRLYSDKEALFSSSSEYADGKVFNYLHSCMPQITKGILETHREVLF